MRLVKWDKLPADMQTEEVREYYDVLRKKRFSHQHGIGAR